MLDVEIFLLDIGEMSIDQKLGSPLYNFFNICMCTSCRGWRVYEKHTIVQIKSKYKILKWTATTCNHFRVPSKLGMLYWTGSGVL